jgi:hypothetical protein
MLTYEEQKGFKKKIKNFFAVTTQVVITILISKVKKNPSTLKKDRATRL